MDINVLDAFLKKIDAENHLLERIPQKIIWMSGAPAAGKGTNARYIIEHGKLYHTQLVASSLLKTPTMLAKINQGLLLDDVTVISAVLTGLQNPLYKAGLLVDGYPRTEGQAYSIDWLNRKLLQRGKQPNFSMLILTLNEEESVRRQLYRGKRAQDRNARLKELGHGDFKEVRLTDLDPKIAHQRYQTFMRETYVALQTLKNKLPFIIIDTCGSLREVKKRILSAIETLNLKC